MRNKDVRKPRRSSRGVCPETGKQQYRNPSGVQAANQQNVKRIRAYQCPHCSWWHATSQPKWGDDVFEI